jgi:hypothetical protein
MVILRLGVVAIVEAREARNPVSIVRIVRLGEAVEVESGEALAVSSQSKEVMNSR